MEQSIVVEIVGVYVYSCVCVWVCEHTHASMCEYMHTRPSVYISLIPRPSNTFEGLGMRLVCI